MWHLYETRNGDDDQPATEQPVASRTQSHAEALAAHLIPIGTPYLLSPSFEYDVWLNEFFYSVEMLIPSTSARVISGPPWFVMSSSSRERGVRSNANCHRLEGRARSSAPAAEDHAKLHHAALASSDQEDHVI